MDPRARVAIIGGGIAGVSLASAGRDSELGQEPRHRRDIGQVRNIFEPQRLIRQQARGHQWQRRILGAGYGNLAAQRNTAIDNQFVHVKAGLQA